MNMHNTERLNTHSLRKYDDINWTERESSLKYCVRSNTKQKKCSWPDCRIVEIRVISRESSWKAESSFKKLTRYLLITYLLSRTIAVKVSFFIIFFLDSFNISKYTHIHRRDSRIQLYYQRVAGVFWGWVMTAWKRPMIPAVHRIHYTSMPILKLYEPYRGSYDKCEPYRVDNLVHPLKVRKQLYIVDKH